MTQDIVLVTPEDLDNTTLFVNASSKLEVVTATETVRGVTQLSVAANFPESADDKAVTPDYLQAALDAMPDIFE